ncbi:MAG: hypothetical protein M3Q89_08620, partial [Verrucomicrobiota bacterium]|nr:hypothetical protein [Verrucomicrobiota bacterium]
ILQLNGNGGGTFTNTGSIVAATGGVLRFNGTVNSSGTVDVDSNSLTATGTYTQTGGTFRLAGGTAQSNNALNFQGGLVDARGTINSSIINNATLRPALGGSGLNVTGNLSLLSASNLVFQLGGLTQGSQYGFIGVNGTVSLGGNLVVSFVNQFQASSNDNFTVLSSTAPLTGQFANVASGSRLTTTGNAGSFLVNYTGSTIVLSNFQSVGARSGFLSKASSVTGEGATAEEGERIAVSGAPAKNAEVQPERESTPGGRTALAFVRGVPNGRPGKTADVSPAREMIEQQDLPGRARSADRRTLASGERRQLVAVNLESSNQLLDLLDGAESTSAKGNVTVNAKRVAKAAQGKGQEKMDRRLPNDTRNTRADGKVDRSRERPINSSSARGAVMKMAISGSATDLASP